jgi:hypothetical protein
MKDFLLAGFVVFFTATAAQAGSIVGLGSAQNFTVLGLTNTDLNFSNDTVTGNVGLSGNGTLTNNAPSAIHGTVFKDSTATVTGSGTITGGIVNQSMTTIVNDALNASSTDGALTPTQTFLSVTSPTTFIRPVRRTSSRSTAASLTA